MADFTYHHLSVTVLMVSVSTRGYCRCPTLLHALCWCPELPLVIDEAWQWIATAASAVLAVPGNLFLWERWEGNQLWVCREQQGLSESRKRCLSRFTAYIKLSHLHTLGSMKRTDNICQRQTFCLSLPARMGKSKMKREGLQLLPGAFPAVPKCNL